MDPIRPQVQVSMKDTTTVTCENCGGITFNESCYLQQVSRILTGAPKDSYVPVPTFTCTACNHVNKEFVPDFLKTHVAPQNKIVT